MGKLYSEYVFIRELGKDYSLYRCIMTHCQIPYYVILNRDGKVVKSRRNRSDNDKLILVKEWEKDICKQAEAKAKDESEMRRMFQNYNNRIARKYFGKNVRDDLCVRSGGKVYVV